MRFGRLGRFGQDPASRVRRNFEHERHRLTRDRARRLGRRAAVDEDEPVLLKHADRWEIRRRSRRNQRTTGELAEHHADGPGRDATPPPLPRDPVPDR